MRRLWRALQEGEGASRKFGKIERISLARFAIDTTERDYPARLRRGLLRLSYF
jgi:hypothetical protein